jgi:hypothetical protein
LFGDEHDVARQGHQVLALVHGDGDAGDGGFSARNTAVRATSAGSVALRSRFTLLAR